MTDAIALKQITEILQERAKDTQKALDTASFTGNYTVIPNLNVKKTQAKALIEWAQDKMNAKTKKEAPKEEVKEEETTSKTSSTKKSTKS